MTAGVSQFAHTWAVPRVPAVRRRIPPQSGRALEKLGHAIDYLSDEFMVAPRDSNGSMEAILLLMEINRRIYAECPRLPSFGQRLSALFRRLA
jgi:hypothetical protein